MIKIGIAGIGFMGMIHYQAIKRIPGVTVSAIATRDPKKRAGDWTAIQGNFGPRGGQEDLSGVESFASADEMIAHADIDLVDICLPSNQHVAPTLAALRAGRHVLVEKPIALSLADADVMVREAQVTGKMLMVAHVLPFFADFRFALESIHSGRFGKLNSGHFRRHISPPDWSSSVADFGAQGGPLIDLHIHDNHFLVVACGKPRQVFSTGRIDRGIVTYVSTNYIYSDGPALSATSGCLSRPSRPFTHGYELYFDEATIHYEAGSPLRVYTTAGMETPTLTAGDEIDSFRDEITAAVDAIRSKSPSRLLDGTLARDALALCTFEQQSIESGAIIDVT